MKTRHIAVFMESSYNAGSFHLLPGTKYELFPTMSDYLSFHNRGENIHQGLRTMTIRHDENWWYWKHVHDEKYVVWVTYEISIGGLCGLLCSDIITK